MYDLLITCFRWSWVKEKNGLARAVKKDLKQKIGKPELPETHNSAQNISSTPQTKFFYFCKTWKTKYDDAFLNNKIYSSKRRKKPLEKQYLAWTLYDSNALIKLNGD